MDILKNLFGRDRPHKETLIDFGPWNEDSAVPIYNELLRVKHYESIFDFTDEETRRIFNRPKSEVQGTYGILGTSECYRIAMVLIAHKLRKTHGDLVEVQCSYDPDSEDPWRIKLLYEDRHKINIVRHSGHVDVTMMKFGYQGTGPDCFYVFLNESGFSISLEEVENMEAPCALRK